MQIMGRELGSTGLAVSEVGMGCVKLGSISSGQGRRGAIRLVREAVDAGVRLFDTADAYGSGLSESVLGEALQAVREPIVVATKVGYLFDERSAGAQRVRKGWAAASTRLPLLRGHASAAYSRQDFSTAYVRQAVHGSLRRLRRDRLDLLQFHGPGPATDPELPEVVQQLLDEGLIAAFGIGSEHLDVASSWVDVAGVGAVQLAVGVLDPQAVATVIPRARAQRVGVIARGVLGGGVLAGWMRGEPTGLDPARVERVRLLAELGARCGTDVMQVAFWYARLQVGADAVLVGISSSEQLTAITRMLAHEPPPGVLSEICAIVEGAS
jgi:aryl-alcohol dehydrogenase-like predicted oxidoreductase